MTVLNTALEFYSGIGGLHLALDRTGINASVAASFDWDHLAAQTYAANHPNTPVIRTDISCLTADYLRSFSADAWLLSPSCQPYTVLNPDAKGADDPRAQSFLHLIRNIIPELHRTSDHPKFMLVENVAGFEASTTRETLLKVMRSHGYSTQEFLINPLQFGIPNSRTRYYLLARSSAVPPFPPITQEDVLDYIPGRCTPLQHDMKDASPLSTYLDSPSESNYNQYRVPDKILGKWGRLFDIVLPSQSRSNCFTRGYTRLVEGSGSILQMNEELGTTQTFDTFLEAQATGNPDALQILHPLKLRYFSPAELLRIFHFVEPTGKDTDFVWPANVSNKVKYRLIGNSVNVKVVRELILYLVQ